MPPAGFARIDHTADVGLRLTAPCPAELFVVAAAGLRDLWGLPEMHITADEPDDALRVAGDDVEALLIAWLNELIYQAEANERVAAAVREPRLEPPAFRARVVWRPLDWSACEDGVDIKAATYHTVQVTPANGGVTTTVIFDV